MNTTALLGIAFGTFWLCLMAVYLWVQTDTARRVWKRISSIWRRRG